MTTIPPSSNTARVRMIDTTAVMAVRAEAFIRPVIPGLDRLSLTTVAFIIENKQLGKTALFDLGVRKDFWNAPPAVLKRIEAAIPGVKVEKDVTEILTDGGVKLESLDDIIWSHSHWDHVGSTFRFPSTTNLVYGEDTGPFPGYPENPDSALNAADFEGRNCVTIDFSSNLTIGGFPAHDFWDDGSLYLLDAPGHLPGHVCALVRTTPNSFVFLGGDICHFAGDFRPSGDIPLPDPVPESTFARNGNSGHRRALYPMPCPCAFFTDHHPQQLPPQQSESTPFFQLSTHHHSSYRDPGLATRTMLKMQKAFDADSRVLVCLAHDPSLLVHLPTFNDEPERDINDWKAQGVKEKCHWGWLGELPRYEGDGTVLGPGMREKPIIDGIWRDNSRVTRPE